MDVVPLIEPNGIGSATVGIRMEARTSVRQRLTRLIKLSTAANALLFPSSSCIHVARVHPDSYRDAVAVTISQEQYKRLVEYIGKSFRLNNDGEYFQIPGEAYSTNDAFYLSADRYHLLNTCNSWVGRGLKSAGVKTPWFSPMPKSPTLYIENEQIVK